MQSKLIANCETVKSKREMKKSWLEILKSNHAKHFNSISVVVIEITICLQVPVLQTTWVRTVA